MRTLLAGSIAECLGAFALMFVGGAAIINMNEAAFGPDLLAVAMAHGLILAVTVSALMHVSGAQFNPAVSAALLLIGKQPAAQAGAFIAAQLAGAAAAAALLAAAFPPDAVEATRLGATLGALSSDPGRDLIALIGLELVATFLLMLVILGSAVDQRGVGKNAAVGGFAIGLVVAALILAIGPLTGASMNPSRSFGPALVGGHWDAHWAYWIAPIIGAALAALLWRTIIAPDESADAADV